MEGMQPSRHIPRTNPADAYQRTQSGQGRTQPTHTKGHSQANSYQGRTQPTTPPSLYMYGERLIPDFQNSVIVSKVIFLDRGTLQVSQCTAGCMGTLQMT